MEIVELDIGGCFLIKPRILNDDRGYFVKTMNKEVFDKYGLDSNFTEEYYSLSKKNVLRGLHFQKPPADHTKLVYCIEGEVLDAFVDLRKESPTFMNHQTLLLDSETKYVLYLSPGIAHGFYTLSDEAVMVYKTSTCYDPERDDGVLWNSCGIDWGVKKPIVSLRDELFQKLDDYRTPF